MLPPWAVDPCALHIAPHVQLLRDRSPRAPAANGFLMCRAALRFQPLQLHAWFYASKSCCVVLHAGYF